MKAYALNVSQTQIKPAFLESFKKAFKPNVSISIMPHTSNNSSSCEQGYVLLNI